MKKLIQRLCFNSKHCFLRVYFPFIYQIACNLQSCLCSPLAVSGLQEEQFPVFNGKFHILHIPVMIFQSVCNFNKLCVTFRQIFLQLGNRLGGSDTCNHVLALGVDQIFTVNTLCPCRRITGKCHTGSRCIAHIAKNHSLYIDCRSPVSGDVIHSAVYDCPLIIPGTEHGLNGLHKLNLGILREIFIHFIFINCFEPDDYFLQIISG